MRHARDDYNRIQDPAGLIPAAEPVFLIRGQDINAAPTLRYYAALVRMNARPGSETAALAIADATEEQALRMERWPVKKHPDMPAQPVIPGDGSAGDFAGYIRAMIEQAIAFRDDRENLTQDRNEAGLRVAVLQDVHRFVFGYGVEDKNAPGA